MVALPLFVKLLVVSTLALLGASIGSHMWRTKRVGVDDVLKQAPWLALVAVLAGADAIAAWVLTLRNDLTWALPLWLQYWASAVNWAVVLASLTFLLSLAITLAFMARDPRRWALVALGAVSLGAVEWYQVKLLIRPKLGDRTTDDGVVLQTSGQSCGAAAGANVARWFGLRRSERDMASLFGTSMGTSAAQVIYGLRELGIEGQQVRVEPKALARLAPPALLYLEAPSALAAGHVVMFAGAEGGAAVILDSLSGRRTASSGSGSRRPRLWHSVSAVAHSTTASDGRAAGGTRAAPLERYRILSVRWRRPARSPANASAPKTVA